MPQKTVQGCNGALTNKAEKPPGSTLENSVLSGFFLCIKLLVLLYFYAAFALTEYRIFSLQAMAADGILIPKQRCRQKWLENAGMERVCGIGYTQRD